MYDSFDHAGKTYGRSQYGLIWSRPDKAAVVFKKEPGDGSALANGPRAAVSIGGKPYLCYRTADRVRLVPPGGGPPFEAKTPADKGLDDVAPRDQQLDEAGHRVVFFTDGLLAYDTRPADGTTFTFAWDYQVGAVAESETRTADLFRRAGSRYEPTAAVVVADH